MPIDLGFGRVVPFGHLTIVNGGWRDQSASVPHQGLDIGVPVGTPILAAADGVVTRAQPVSINDAGIHVGITHASGVTSRYLHLSQIGVALGQQVLKGQEIGRSGNTGLSEAPHLHFDLKVQNQGLLPMIAESVGEPSTGFGPNLLNTGFGIPAEPWLPVDSYRQTVIDNAARLGIPLHGVVGQIAVVGAKLGLGSYGPFVLIGAAGLALWLLWTD